MHHMAVGRSAGNVTLRYSPHETGLTHVVASPYEKPHNSSNW